MGSIKHVFTHPVADGTNSSIVRPSDWNSIHQYTIQDAVSLGGNTAGILTLISTGVLLLIGGSNVTLSQSNNSVTISGADAAPPFQFSNSNGVSFGTNGSTITATVATNYQSQGAYLTTGMASNRASDFVAATAAFAGTNASGTIASNGVSISVAAGGGDAIRGIAAAGATLTTASVNFSNSNGVSFGLGVGGNSTVMTASHNALTTARASTDAVGLNTALTANGVSWTVNSSGVSLNVPAFLTTAALSNHSHGNPTLNLTNLSGTTASNSAGFTLSLSAGTQAPSPVNFSAGTTSGNLGSVVFSNSNQVSFGLSGSTITASIPGTSSVVGTSGISVSTNGASVSIYVSAGNSNGVSFGFNTDGVMTGSVQTSYAASNHSHGNPTLNLTNLSGTTGSNSAGFTLSLSAAAPGAGGGINVAVNALTTYTSGTVVFSNSNGVTFGTAGQTVTATVKTDYLTTAMLSNAVTLSNIRISGGTTSGLLSALTLADSNGVSFGLNAGTMTATVKTDYQTSGAYLTTAALSNHSHGNPTLNLTNLSGTTASASNGFTLSLSAAAPGAASENNWMTLLGANVSGNSSASGTTIGLSGVNLTLSGTNGSQIVLSAPATSSLVGTNGISISTNGSTISIGAADPMVSQYDPYNNAPVSNSTLGQSTIYFAPFDIPEQISASRINFFLSLTHTYSGAPPTGTAWLALGYGLYTRGTGTNSDRMSLLTSYSLSYISGNASSSTRLSVTNYVGLSNVTSHSTSQYGVQNATVSDYLGSSLAGYRVLALPLNLTLKPGRSWLGLSVQSGSQGGSFVLGHSVLQLQFSNNIAYRALGAVSAGSNASFFGASDGLGIYSAQTAAWPATIPLTSDSIRGAPIVTLPYFNFSGIGTSTNIL
jgi:hypothetical protein